MADRIPSVSQASLVLEDAGLRVVVVGEAGKLSRLASIRQSENTGSYQRNWI